MQASLLLYYYSLLFTADAGESESPPGLFTTILLEPLVCTILMEPPARLYQQGSTEATVV